jgi:hypothetical protein
MMAMTHIQNTAPKPPAQMAVEMPMGRGGYHQRLEGRGRPGLLRFFSHHTDGFQEHTELDEAGPEGEVQTRSQQQDDEHIAVHHSADVADQFVDHNTHTHFL